MDNIRTVSPAWQPETPTVGGASWRDGELYTSAALGASRSDANPFFPRLVHQLWPALGVSAALHAGPVAVELQPDAAVPWNKPPEPVQHQPWREDRCELAAQASRKATRRCISVFISTCCCPPDVLFLLSDCGFSGRSSQSGEGGDLLVLLPRDGDSGVFHQHRRILSHP